jgi:hypothetical protein
VEPKHTCENCEEAAFVHIKSEVAGQVVVRHLCRRCADVEDNVVPPRERGLDAAIVVTTTGLLVLVTSVLADPLGFGSSEGFGWQQWTGVAVAAILTLIGAIMRVSTLLVVGLIIGGVTILADWLGLGSAEGFGWQQILGSALGVLLIAIGLLVARSLSRDAA